MKIADKRAADKAAHETRDRIPIRAVTAFERGIQLNMPKATIRSRPLVVVEESQL